MHFALKLKLNQNNYLHLYIDGFIILLILLLFDFSNDVRYRETNSESTWNIKRVQPVVQHTYL